jgi:hypothetical protein
MGVGGQRHITASLPQGRDLVPILQKAKWAAGPCGDLPLPGLDPVPSTQWLVAVLSYTELSRLTASRSFESVSHSNSTFLAPFM